MNSARKIAFFFIFSWLVAAPLPLLAQANKNPQINLGSLMYLGSVTGSASCLLAVACLLKTGKIPGHNIPIKKNEEISASCGFLGASVLLTIISLCFSESKK